VSLEAGPPASDPFLASAPDEQERSDERASAFPAWLTGARAAPSAHNTQPWQFTPQADGRVAVGWDEGRTLPVADPTSRDLYLSLGAAAESACLRATASGTRLRFEAAPPGLAGPVGWLVPDPGTADPAPDDRLLAAALDARQTARSPHLPRAVPASVRAAMVAEAARHGRTLTIVTDRPSIRRLASLTGKATALLFADGPVHAELWRWLRLDPGAPAYQRDGLTADCLGLAGTALWVARQTMPPARMRWLARLGLHTLLAADMARVARRSAAICLLSTPATDRAALVETGRVLQRLWLLAAAHGLTTHPLSALLDCPETAGATVDTLLPLSRLRERGLGGEAGPAMPAAVFRLGYSGPAPRAPRLPLAELCARVGSLPA